MAILFYVLTYLVDSKSGLSSTAEQGTHNSLVVGSNPTGRIHKALCRKKLRWRPHRHKCLHCKDLRQLIACTPLNGRTGVLPYILRFDTCSIVSYLWNAQSNQIRPFSCSQLTFYLTEVEVWYIMLVESEVSDDSIQALLLHCQEE